MVDYFTFGKHLLQEEKCQLSQAEISDCEDKVSNFKASDKAEVEYTSPNKQVLVFTKSTLSIN